MKDVKKPHYISTLHYICVFVHLATVCADFYVIFFISFYYSQTFHLNLKLYLDP